MKELKLPGPRLKGRVSLEEAIMKRRSLRHYSDQTVSLADISQILWAAQGITSKRGFRAVPSAGALYPLEIYIVNQDGVFHYIPLNHTIVQTKNGDLRGRLCDAALGQKFIAEAPVSIVICAVYERVKVKYGQRGERYTDIEVGHAAQNIHLEAVALGLGTVSTGAFNDGAVKKLLGLAKDEKPLYIIPVGYKKKRE